MQRSWLQQPEEEVEDFDDCDESRGPDLVNITIAATVMVYVVAVCFFGVRVLRRKRA